MGKKISALILAAVTAVSLLSVFPAAVGAEYKAGDSLGDVLYSDITAYINGDAIPTSVIDGKTLVVVEDLAKYGFDVVWNNNDRSLKAEPNKSKAVKPLPVEKDDAHKAGTFKCSYLYTDIKTYFSGEEIESFAIDGSTLTDFELLAKYGKLTWDGEAREIRVVTNDKFIVFWGQTGTRIHIDPYCRTFSLAVNSGTLDEALAAKRGGWCAACSGGWSDERLLKEGNPNAQKFYAHEEK